MFNRTINKNKFIYFKEEIMGCCDPKKENFIVKWFKDLFDKVDQKLEKESQEKSCCCDKDEDDQKCCS